MSSKFVLVFLFILTIFTRFYKIDWGEGYYFHPDENNMASAISGLRLNDLNPRFFAYGQFPLYLVFFTQTAVHFLTHRVSNLVSYEEAIFGLRFFSAIFSCLSVYVLWKLGNLLFRQKKHQYLLAFISIFSPGLIQLSHFGTTESILIFVFSSVLLFTVNFIKKQKTNFRQIFLISLILGIGISSKIISLVFIAPIAIAFCIYFFKKNRKIYIVKWSLILLLLTAFFTCIFSPYNFISYSEFVSSMNYETGVALGTIDVFYTRQFSNTIPYLFQFEKVFPFALGLPVFIFSLLGFFSCKYKKESLIILISSFIYLAYTGQLYIKWFRFMAPIFPVFIIFAVIFLQKIKNKFLFCLLSIISITPGLIFFAQIYFHPDTRIQADKWVKQNIPTGSYILSEERNVISTPFESNKYIVKNFNFYDLDEDPILKSSLPLQLYLSDYIIIPSRRVYKNHPAVKFPITANYYKNLFDGSLGFEKITTISSLDSFLLESNNAEETFTVFDHPQILIYKKIRQIDVHQYKKILNL